ncbi:hypothetical protein [Herbiconiux sp. YIM B11900]|uniref:hypothetical protein n=1 Tax=Herbiconiux sp. YIM B11900 TaxID=3404131 RepID=UPI003F838E22
MKVWATTMRARHARRGAAAIAAVALLAGLSGCVGAGTWGGAGEGPAAGQGAGGSGGADATAVAAQREAARERVADLARAIGGERPHDIQGYARAAVAEVSVDADTIELIGIDEQQSLDVAEPFGSLELRVPAGAAEAASGTPGDSAELPDAYCFRVVFDYYGKVGEWATTDGVESIDCPADAVPVTPEPDETITYVVAVNARESAREVLLAAIQSGRLPSESDVVAEIGQLLEQPEDEFERAAPPRVLIDDAERIGVAMGDADDCVLVKSENGRVLDVRPAPVLLQPGELGCSPSTALADPESLRPPH